MQDIKKIFVRKEVIIMLSTTFLVILFFTMKAIMATFVEFTVSGITAGMKVTKRQFKSSLSKHIFYQDGIFRNPIPKPRKIAVIEREQKFPNRPEGPSENNENLAENLVLEGIIWDNDQQLAIISGQTVSKGETIQGAMVMNISKDGVTLMKDGIEIKLAR